MRLNFQKKVNATGVLAIALLLLVSTNSAFAQDAAASINNVAGYATVTTANGDTKRLAEGDELMEGDILNTGANSSASITLANGEVIQLGELATYTVGAVAGTNNESGVFAQRSLSTKSPTLSTATSAGGGISAPTTPTEGGSPSN